MGKLATLTMFEKQELVVLCNKNLRFIDFFEKFKREVYEEVSSEADVDRKMWEAAKASLEVNIGTIYIFRIVYNFCGRCGLIRRQLR